MNQTIYQFGQFEFSAGTNTLINHQQVESKGIKLEPKVAALLLYFLQHPQRIISKSELIESAWPKTKVTDNIITWALSKLRKALADDPFSPNYIQTIPKQGFQFIPSVEQKSEISTTANSNKKYWPWAIVAAVIVIFLVSSQFVQLNFGRASIGSIKNITSLDGVEVDPELSPANNWLLFRHKATAKNSRYQLNLTPWDGEKSANMAIQLTNDKQEYLSATWGKTENIIYAARIQLQSGRCEIVKLELNELKTHINNHTKILDCNAKGHTKISLSSSGILYFSDKIKSESHYGVFQFNLASQTVSQIRSETNNRIHQHDLSLSLDQSKLLILGQNERMETHLVIYDVLTGTQSEVITLTDDIKSAHLSPDNQEIWISNTNGAITAYKVQGGVSLKLLKATPNGIFNLKAITENLLMYTEQQTANSNQQADIKSITLSEI